MDIVQVVNNSPSCNLVQLVTDEDGTTIVPTFNWADFFAPHMRKIVSIN